MNYRATWDLSTIPDSALKSEWARRSVAKRTTHAGGKPKVMRPCPKCGKPFGAREMVAHKPHCKATTTL